MPAPDLSNIYDLDYWADKPLPDWAVSELGFIDETFVQGNGKTRHVFGKAKRAGLKYMIFCFLDEVSGIPYEKIMARGYYRLTKLRRQHQSPGYLDYRRAYMREYMRDYYKGIRRGPPDNGRGRGA